ncbi:uncharacterized protein FSUBG_3783 [Fusarium subglutinans]|uniref:Uncharacterized protein n=1 Tax=Gibberella subglutinans TaxID=42677 RepID=A0A8H5Q991_GIBSU|nr:uncharacterized protein FSUBG_3783 [Fusarium subglutinans]KAF5609786.1 hypothetical protein FSUBG_3783 [Fusarium subglutinans]
MINVNSSQDSVFKVLSGLESQLRLVEIALRTSSSASPGPSSGREEDDRATQHLQHFVQVAKNFHSSASTILREGPRSTNIKIERWIPSPVDEEPDPDSDIETEFARRFEELAIKNEANGDHAKAEQFYRGAIEHGESSSRPVSDITAMKIRLAYACMRQEKWTEADEIISPIAFERKTNDILVYHGTHALALAYLDNSKLEEAERCCKRALWGKRKVFGKDHWRCWETLDLLVRICKARSKMMEAEVHQSFIPSHATIATDQGALDYLDRSVGSLNRPSNDGDTVSQTRQPLDFQQEYPQGQPYNTAASGPVPSAGRSQYPKTFGSQYTSPSTPNSHQGMIQYPIQHRQTRSNGESSSTPAISRKAIGQPDPILSTMHRPENGANTSVAYVVNDLKNPISELLREWPGAGCYSKSLVPTVIYYDLYNKVVGWGHDIANAVGPTGHPKSGVQKVERLPLFLVQETEEYIPLPGIPPGFNAVDVSADFLYEVRRALGTQLQQRIGLKFLENEQSIHWILTSSEIWADKDKTLWKLLKASPFFASQLMSSKNLGPALIAQNFADIARTRVRRMRLPDGSRIANKVYTKCVSEFEQRIMSEFRNNGQEWDIDVAIETEFLEAGIKGGYMTYTNGEILSCFQPVLDDIIAMMAYTIGEVLKSSNSIEGIILGGEFCTSEYLLREIKLKLPENLRHKVYPPMEPATQVATGAAHLEFCRYLARGQRYVQS